MRAHKATWWGTVLALVLAAGAIAGEAVPDLDKVDGIQELKGPPAARDLLRRNGFVVVPRFYHQIFSPYIQEHLPPFVTTDSLHRTFHVIFEEQIKKLETALAAEVGTITDAMLEACERLRAPGGGADASAALLTSYFRVARALLQGTDAPLGSPAGVGAELRLIRAAAGVEPSPLFGYLVDYTDFRPRGFYTETPLLSRYFQAMTWYGHAAFRLVSDAETRAAMVLAQQFRQNADVRRRWKKMDDLYTHLLAPTDDLTPEEYAGVLDAMDKAGPRGDPLAAFRELAAKLRDPKINSMVILPDAMPRWRVLSKGLRFFGPLRRIFGPLDPGIDFGIAGLAAAGQHQRRRRHGGKGQYPGANAHRRRCPGLRSTLASS